MAPPAAASPPATMSEGQRKTLNTIAELTGRTTTTVIRDSIVVVKYSNNALSAKEVHNYINQLQGLGYISIDTRAKGGVDFRLINMTTQGLDAATSSSDTNNSKQELR
jgi:Cdc6-like AAA superfamily ATPase